MAEKRLEKCTIPLVKSNERSTYPMDLDGSAGKYNNVVTHLGHQRKNTTSSSHLSLFPELRTALVPVPELRTAPIPELQFISEQ